MDNTYYYMYYYTPDNFSYYDYNFSGAFDYSQLDTFPDSKFNHLVPFIYLVIFLIGMFGNILVVIVFVKNKTFRTITNIYLLNLAVIDIMYLLCGPLTATFVWLGHWVFGAFLCILVHYLLVVCMSVHILTLTAIGIDRYISVVHPVYAKQYRSKKVTIIVIICIWLVSTSGFSPNIAFLKEFEWLNNRKICMENFSLQQQRIYTMAIFVLLYCIPLLILAFCYIKIALKMRHGMNETSRFVSIRMMTIQTRKRVLKIVFSVTWTFAICWLPIHVLAIKIAFSRSMESWLFDLQILAPCFPYATTAINPIIYCFVSKTFRKIFISSFKCERLHLHPFIFGEEPDVRQRTAPQRSNEFRINQQSTCWHQPRTRREIPGGVSSCVAGVEVRPAENSNCTNL